ncbi:MAG TPA: RNA polymerase sigma factor, partial [Novosphingobium sp.]|nr:RNA polymerase sigma factor [Novosphingobium sp.]
RKKRWSAGIMRQAGRYGGECMAAGEAAEQTFRNAVIAALPRLRRFCQGLVGNAQDGDDLMQSTVERALARSHQFVPGTRLDSWMFRIAQNLHIDGARVAGRRGHQVPIDDLPETMGEDGRVTVEDRSDLVAAQRALQSIPEDQRAAFLLVVVEGLSYREAAEVLEVPVGTIMSRLARARGRIEQVVGRGREALP